jgi:DNA-binding FadR family transcriptional regulator
LGLFAGSESRMDIAPPAAIRREALYQTVQDRIKRYIIERGFRPGDPLPAEAELARALGVSRPSLREAMKALQILGVVETRHGAGTFVGRFSFSPMVDGLIFRIRSDLGRDLQTVHDLLEIRMTLENALVTRIAAAPTPEHLAELRGIVERMEIKAAQGEEFFEEDRLFHEALYRPLGNALLVRLIQAFWEIHTRVRSELPFDPVPPSTTAADHRRIVAALEAGDSVAATAAMTDHFTGLLRRFKQPSPIPSVEAVTSPAGQGESAP